MKTLEQLGISPTPWASVIVRKDIFIDNKQGQTIANVWCNSSSTTANTRLIAAAPELYEALAALLNCSEKEAPFTMESGMSIAMDMARKAIEKAGDASPATSKRTFSPGEKLKAPSDSTRTKTDITGANHAEG